MHNFWLKIKDKPSIPGIAGAINRKFRFFATLYGDNGQTWSDYVKVDCRPLMEGSEDRFVIIFCDKLPFQTANLIILSMHHGNGLALERWILGTKNYELLQNNDENWPWFARIDVQVLRYENLLIKPIVRCSGSITINTDDSVTKQEPPKFIKLRSSYASITLKE